MGDMNSLAEATVESNLRDVEAQIHLYEATLQRRSPSWWLERLAVRIWWLPRLRRLQSQLRSAQAHLRSLK
jgi:hypothetical protein